MCLTWQEVRISRQVKRCLGGSEASHQVLVSVVPPMYRGKVQNPTYPLGLFKRWGYSQLQGADYCVVYRWALFTPDLHIYCVGNPQNSIVLSKESQMPKVACLQNRDDSHTPLQVKHLDFQWRNETGILDLLHSSLAWLRFVILDNEYWIQNQWKYPSPQSKPGQQSGTVIHTGQIHRHQLLQFRESVQE